MRLRLAALCCIFVQLGCDLGVTEREIVSRPAAPPTLPDLAPVSAPCQDSSAISRSTASASPEAGFAILFRAGEQCGATESLPTLVSTARELTPEQAMIFLDGAAHTHPFKLDNIAESIQTVNKNVPMEYRTVLLKGIGLSQALAFGDNPTRMAKFSAAFQEASGQPPPFDGIRVGVQRKLGERMDEAIAITLQYPEPFHRPLLEELGWRATVRRDPYTVSQSQTLQALPEVARCIFMRGAVRGWLLRHDLGSASDWAELMRTVQPVLEACPEEAEMGLAWGIIDRFHDTAAMDSAVHQLNQVQSRPTFTERMRRLWPVRIRVNVWDPSP